MAEFAHTVFYLRVIERLAISGLVSAVALVILVAFWRTVHRVDFNVTREKIGLAGTTLIATPVLVLLILVGFAWVVLTNKISLDVAMQSPQEVNRSILAPSEANKTGQGSAQQPVVIHEDMSGITDIDVNVAALLLEFNCALSHVANPPSELEISARKLKVVALLPKLPPDWTKEEKKVLYDWAMGANDSKAPRADATRIMSGVSQDCGR
jgi:hypothetical protein